jgi:hypothetical protein
MKHHKHITANVTAIRGLLIFIFIWFRKVRWGAIACLYVAPLLVFATLVCPECRYQTGHTICDDSEEPCVAKTTVTPKYDYCDQEKESDWECRQNEEPTRVVTEFFVGLGGSPCPGGCEWGIWFATADNIYECWNDDSECGSIL